jgi:arginine decarboxylase
MKKWSVQDSLELYSIPRWGKGMLDANESGHLRLNPGNAPESAVDLYALVCELKERGIDLPILLRFPDVLKRRVETLVECFSKAFGEYEYRGNYRGVYPIKVNQQGDLVRELVEYCRPHHLGLEAGSKAEFLITLALLEDPEALIVCNGYKDSAYVETAMLSQKLGRSPIIVIEKLHELDTIVAASKKLGIRPRLGIRGRLTNPGKGRWKRSAGDRAKFGLTIQGIVQAVHRLRDEQMLDCLEMLHFHIGSQVTAIRTFKDALTEASRLYAELVRMGAPMGLLDVGGGLGVDYDGSQTNFEGSMNYSEQEYASDVVWAIADVCNSEGIPHPDIVTESGRALSAHHAVLVFDVIGIDTLPTLSASIQEPKDDIIQLQNMWEIYESINARNYQEAWHDAQHCRGEALHAFNFGLLTLEQRAEVERIFWRICGKIQEQLRKAEYVPEDLESVERALADIYFCNFSVFQSIPDSWAIKQLFPIVPLHRLDQEPTRRAVLADLTCDSDGMIDRFVDLRDVKDVLELHPYSGKPYFLGCFLVGAYQEILGDLHNLFGDTNAVMISINGDGSYKLDSLVDGLTLFARPANKALRPKDLLGTKQEPS